MADNNEQGHLSDKKITRNEVLVRRNALPLKDRLLKSKLICEHVYDYLKQKLAGSTETEPTFLAGKNIAMYSVMKSEVSLDPFIDKAYRQGANVCFPCMTKKPLEDDRTFPDAHFEKMVFRTVPEAHYEKHRGGDTEAVRFMSDPLKTFFLQDETLCDFPHVSPRDFDIVIVPMVAFDKHFNRLGYGGGNYDRFLADIRDDAIVIGVAFAEQEIDVVPLEPHDLPLPIIISA